MGVLGQILEGHLEETWKKKVGHFRNTVNTFHISR